MCSDPDLLFGIAFKYFLNSGSVFFFFFFLDQNQKKRSVGVGGKKSTIGIADLLVEELLAGDRDGLGGTGREGVVHVGVEHDHTVSFFLGLLEVREDRSGLQRVVDTQSPCPLSRSF